MRYVTFLPLIALAACQNSPPPTANEVAGQRQTDAPVRDIDTIPADETAAAAEGDGDGAPPPDQAAIPAALHGRWGLVPADCTSTRGDAKGLMTITGDMLAFYESRARLRSVTNAEPGRLTGSFAFTGEGQSWARNVTLRLEGGALLRSDEEITTPLRYARCA